MDIPDEATPASVVSALGGSLVDAAGRTLAADAARERSERLAALHRQRMLLAGLRDDAVSSLRRLPVADNPDWISEAQRQFAARHAELRHELLLTVRALDAALAGVTEAIATLAEPG